MLTLLIGFTSSEYGSVSKQYIYTHITFDQLLIVSKNVFLAFGLVCHWDTSKGWRLISILDGYPLGTNIHFHRYFTIASCHSVLLSRRN